MKDIQQDMTKKQHEYWKKNTRLIKVLLVIWALVSLVAAIILAKPLSEVQFFGVPLAFWFAQQGSIIIFLILIFYYAKRMDKLDEEYDVQEVILTKKKKAKNKGVST
jgi:putative solute:sodium symporter small subunit